MSNVKNVIPVSGQIARTSFASDVFCFPTDVEIAAPISAKDFNSLVSFIAHQAESYIDFSNSVTGNNSLMIQIKQECNSNDSDPQYITKATVCIPNIDADMFLEETCLTRDGYVNAFALYDHVDIDSDNNIMATIVTR